MSELIDIKSEMSLQYFVPITNTSPTHDDLSAAKCSPSVVTPSNIFPFGYARSQAEARRINDASKFRQLPCRTFISSGTCPYRERCVYLHDPRVAARELKNRTRRKNKEDIVLDSMFWPVMPACEISKNLEASGQPAAVQMYFVPAPQVDKYCKHDQSIFSVWNHFVSFCDMLTPQGVTSSDRGVCCPRDSTSVFPGANMRDIIRCDAKMNVFTGERRLDVFTQLSNGVGGEVLRSSNQASTPVYCQPSVRTAGSTPVASQESYLDAFTAFDFKPPTPSQSHSISASACASASASASVRASMAAPIGSPPRIVGSPVRAATSTHKKEVPINHKAISVLSASASAFSPSTVIDFSSPISRLSPIEVKFSDSRGVHCADSVFSMPSAQYFTAQNTGSNYDEDSSLPTQLESEKTTIAMQSLQKELDDCLARIKALKQMEQRNMPATGQSLFEHDLVSDVASLKSYPFPLF